MMSLEAIKANGQEVARQAAEEGKRPLAINEAEWMIDLNSCQEGRKPSTLSGIPNLGDPDLLSDEWEIVETYFVDKTGWDFWDAGGPALPIGRLCEEGLQLTKDRGTLYWFMGDEGEFQTYIFATRKAE